jgi:hypothetical protein
MYAPLPPSVDTEKPRRRRRGPRSIDQKHVAACCMGTTTFFIAASTVLALIPFYTPTRNASATGTTKTYCFVLTPNQTLGDDGILNGSSVTNLEQAISSALGLNVNSLTIDSNVVVATTSSGRRRRRGFSLERSERGLQQNVYSSGVFQRKYCGVCRFTQTSVSFTVELFYGGATLFIQFTCYIYSGAGSVPATVGSSTATAIFVNTTNATSINGTTTNTTIINANTTSNSSGSG